MLRVKQIIAYLPEADAGIPINKCNSGSPPKCQIRSASISYSEDFGNE